MVSNKYKCIFIHIPKCGGLSVQDKFLDEFTSKELLLGKNRNPKKGPPRFNHLMSSEYILNGHISKDDFDNYFKFSFVRNPWSRFVSLYHYLGYSRITDFNKFVFKYFEKSLWENKNWYWFVRPQYDYIYDAQDILQVDFLGRTENLQEDFKHVCEQINFKNYELTHKNKSSEKSNFHPLFIKLILSNPSRIFNFYQRDRGKKNYRDYFNSESRILVRRLYEIDIDTFKYTF